MTYTTRYLNDYKIPVFASATATNYWDAPAEDSGWVKFNKRSGGTTGGSHAFADAYSNGGLANYSDGGPVTTIRERFIAACKYKKVTGSTPTANTVTYIMRSYITTTAINTGVRESWTNTGSLLKMQFVTSGLVIGTSGTLSLDTEYLIVWCSDDSTGYHEMRIYDNAGAIVYRVGISLQAGVLSTADRIMFGADPSTRASSAHYHHLRHFVILDQVSVIEDLGVPWEVGADQGFTDDTVTFTPSAGANDATIDDTATPWVTDTTDYNATPTADSSDKSDLFTVTDYPGTLDQVRAAMIWTYSSGDGTYLGFNHKTKVDDGTNTLRLLMSLLSLNLTSFVVNASLWDVAPDGSAMTTSGYNGMKVGYERHGSLQGGPSASQRYVATVVLFYLAFDDPVYPSHRITVGGD